MSCNVSKTVAIQEKNSCRKLVGIAVVLHTCVPH